MQDMIKNVFAQGSKREQFMEKAQQLAGEINSKAGQTLFDWPLLQKTCLDKRDLVVKLLGLFSQQTPGWIENLQNSVESGDIKKIREHCHTIIGATSAIHAQACVSSLKRLHSFVKENSGDRQQTKKILNDAIVALQKTKEASDKLLIACSAN